MPRAGTASEALALGVLGSHKPDRCELSGLAVIPWHSRRAAGLRAAESQVYKLEI